jgi:phosphate-selective porin OprO/OprP
MLQTKFLRAALLAGAASIVFAPLARAQDDQPRRHRHHVAQSGGLEQIAMTVGAPEQSDAPPKKLAMTAAATAQGDDPPRKHRHHVAQATGSDRLEELERRLDQQAQEIQDLKAQLNQGQPSGQVSSTQFEALQNQVYETQATVKAATANQAAVQFKQQSPYMHSKTRVTISSPDGKYTFQPIALVQGDFASYSKSQPLPNGNVNGKFDLKSSGVNFRRAQIGFQGNFAGDFGYKFFYDFGGTNGNETYQAFAGPNSATTTTVLQCNVPLVAGVCPAGHLVNTTITNTAFNTSTGSGTGPHIKEAWVSYKGILDPFTFKMGALPPPANLADMTSSDDLLFNERATPAQVSRGLAADDGRESVGFIGNGSFDPANALGPLWNASFFMTGDTFGKAALLAPQTTYAGSQEAIVTRVAVDAWHDPDSNLNVHIGGNLSYVVHPQEATSVTPPGVSGVTTFPITFSDRPELRVDNVTFINTGGINADNAYAVGVEGAFSYDRFLIEGENFWYHINRNNPAPGVTNPDFFGWYVEAAVSLSGDVRAYNPATASFMRPSPLEPFDPLNGGWGAWEAVGRYSYSDFNNDVTSAIPADRVFGGIQRIASAGINFYPNDVFKFMLDLQHVELKDIGSLNNDGNYNTISFRGQVSF